MKRVWLAMALLMGSVQGVGAQETGAQTIVLETHVGKKKPDAVYVLDSIYPVLQGAGFQVGDEVARRIRREVSKASSGMEVPADMAQRVELGYDRWLSADFAAAVEQLAEPARLLRENPSTVANDQTYRPLLLKSLVGMSLAYKRLGEKRKALDTMAELVRSFPDREVERSKYGPEAVELFREARQELQDRGMGKLTIEVDDSTVVVFLNERYLAVGRDVKQELLPGTYRVFVQRSMEPGRLHEVTIEPGQSVKMEIQWSLDRALVSEPYPGFLYPSETIRQTLEPGHARMVARTMGANEVVVLAFSEHHGQRALIGTVYSLAGHRPLRAAALPLEPSIPGAKLIESFARFLAGEASSPGVEVLVAPSAPVDEVVEPRADDDGGASPTSDPLFWTGWGAVAAGGGLVGLALYLNSIHGEPRDCEAPDVAQCEFLHNTRAASIGSAAGGVVLLGVGGWLVYRGFTKESSGTQVSVTPLPGGVFLGVSTDELPWF